MLQKSSKDEQQECGCYKLIVSLVRDKRPLELIPATFNVVTSRISLFALC